MIVEGLLIKSAKALDQRKVSLWGLAIRAVQQLR